MRIKQRSNKITNSTSYVSNPVPSVNHPTRVRLYQTGQFYRCGLFREGTEVHVAYEVQPYRLWSFFFVLSFSMSCFCSENRNSSALFVKNVSKTKNTKVNVTSYVGMCAPPHLTLEVDFIFWNVLSVDVIKHQLRAGPDLSEGKGRKRPYSPNRGSKIKTITGVFSINYL